MHAVPPWSRRNQKFAVSSVVPEQSKDSIVVPFAEQQPGRPAGDVAGEAPAELVQHLLAAVATHAGGATQQDDVTVVVMRRNPEVNP